MTVKENGSDQVSRSKQHYLEEEHCVIVLGLQYPPLSYALQGEYTVISQQTNMYVASGQHDLAPQTLKIISLYRNIIIF